MTILRMSVFVLSFAFCANTFSQTGAQPNYQCSAGTSLNGGYLTYKSSHILAVAKHKDGTVSEVSGILGNLAPNVDFAELTQFGPRPTYAEMAQIYAAINEMAAYSAQLAQNAQAQNGQIQNGTNPSGTWGGFVGGMGMGGGMGGGITGASAQGASPTLTVMGYQVRDTGEGLAIARTETQLSPRSTMTGEAPDREDIESTPTRYVDKRPGDHPGNRPGDYAIGTRPGDNPGQRPGDKVGLRAADKAPAYLTQSFEPRKPTQPKAGELVMKPGNIAYSAHLDSQGNISEITYRIGKSPTRQWRANSKNSAGANNVHIQLASELNNIKSRAFCCTKNPGANCGTSLDQVGAQYSLQTEKPSIGQRMKSAWSDMINAFRTSANGEAK